MNAHSGFLLFMSGWSTPQVQRQRPRLALHFHPHLIPVMIIRTAVIEAQEASATKVQVKLGLVDVMSLTGVQLDVIPLVGKVGPIV